jgi:hypothetical protein
LHTLPIGTVTGHVETRQNTPGYVETRQGDFIGLVLIASLQPLDRRTKNALRREARRTAQARK